MMKPKEFLKTVYLGDRACKKIVIDGWNQLFAMQVDSISRMKEGTDTWNYYNDENIDNGWVVFEKLKSVDFSPAGAVPDDTINGIEVSEDRDGKFVFSISVASSIDGGKIQEATIKVIAESVFLQTNDEFLTRIS